VLKHSPVKSIELKSTHLKVIAKSGTSKAHCWHAVSIVRGRQSCAAIARITGKKWLSAEAPQIPIAGCTLKRCECRYRHHADRRSTDRRESKGLKSGAPKEGERRSSDSDRRNRNADTHAVFKIDLILRLLPG
jgi:hypothetical protein